MSVKTILVAHQSPVVRDRFAAALADAQQDYLVAGTDSALRSAVANDRVPVSLALVDLGLGRTEAHDDPVALVADIRRAGARPVPVVVFAGSVSSAGQIASLAAHGVSGYINEHANTPSILPALAPHLFPDSFNRRASPRVPVALPISFRAGQTIAGAQTRDVGRGGVGIQTMDPLPTGTAIQLTFRLPDASIEIAAFGRVVWSDHRIGMGVQFESLPPDAQQILDAFVDAR